MTAKPARRIRADHMDDDLQLLVDVFPDVPPPDEDAWQLVRRRIEEAAAAERQRSLRSDIPGPSTDSWRRARAAIAIASGTTEVALKAGSPRERSRRSHSRRWRVVGAAATAVVLTLGLLADVGVIGGSSRLSRPLTTAWSPAQPFVHTGSRSLAIKRGSWQLVDDLLAGSREQNLYGPPPDRLSCSPDRICYVLAGHYSSAMAGAPLLSASLYASNDDGASWSVLPVPSGLAPTTALTCSDAKWCAAGGTYNGQPVLAVTHNGGHSFTIDPLPTNAGTL
jgi:hypothetical protein